jgi:hypothetical protein
MLCSPSERRYCGYGNKMKENVDIYVSADDVFLYQTVVLKNPPSIYISIHQHIKASRKIQHIY